LTSLPPAALALLGYGAALAAIRMELRRGLLLFLLLLLLLLLMMMMVMVIGSGG
jgi:hypothetical protein